VHPFHDISQRAIEGRARGIEREKNGKKGQKMPHHPTV